MKVLIIGLGSIASKHIDALRKIQVASAPHRIYALRSSRNARPHDGVTDIYSIEEAIKLEPDFIIISNPTSMHADAIRAVAHSGIPLMIEKPLFEAPSHDLLVECIHKADTLTYVACNLRFLHCLNFVDKHLRSKTMPRRINEVNIYCGSSLPGWRPGSDYRKSYSATPEMGGGVHLDLIHEIDYACHLFGMPRHWTGICRSGSSIGIRAIDYANYTLVYDTFCANITLNYYRPDYRRTMEIVFADDIWTVDLAANTVTDRSGKTIFSSPQKIIDTYTDQMIYFTQIVAGHRITSINDIRHANDILKIASKYERFD